MSVEAGPCIPLEEHKRLLAEAIRCVATATLERAAAEADDYVEWRPTWGKIPNSYEAQRAANEIATRIRALKEKS